MVINKTLQINIIRCKKLAIIVSGRENVTRPFIRQKQVNMSKFVTFCCTSIDPFSLGEVSCCVVSIRNNCWEFFASDCAYSQSFINRHNYQLKTHPYIKDACMWKLTPSSFFVIINDGQPWASIFFLCHRYFNNNALFPKSQNL